MIRFVCTVFALAVAAAAPGFALSNTVTVSDEQATPAYLDLAWADLLPEGEAERINQLM